MLSAQVHRVDPQKTITFPVEGATAAFSLDASLAEATADNGVVSVEGKQPGTTHVVVVTPSGESTFEVLITTPAPRYPPGFVMPINVADLAESGFYEGRYYSSPSEIQNQLDVSKIHGDDRTHVHIVETSFLAPLQSGQPRVALSSATYQIVTPRRDITLFDLNVTESPLTLNGSIIRGFHMQQDNWFVHAGYTTVATFQGLFLPTQPELVIEGGYRYPLTANSSISASFNRIQVPASDLIGHSGNVGLLSYRYSPRESFWFTADLGISRGIGGAVRVYYKSERDSVAALIRYVPLQFASVGANSLRGTHSDLAWTRHVNRKLDLALSFYNNNLVLPGLKETTLSGSGSVRYQLTRHWALTGGVIASSFQSDAPPSSIVRSLTLPAGLAFQSKHFGATGQYQFGVTPGRDSGGKQFRVSAQSGRGPFSFTGFAQRDTNAPTLSFIFSQVAGLEQALDQLGLRATTIQQVDELLSSNSFLIAAGYIKGATINLVPVRTQLGGSADWSSRGTHRKQLSYSFLYTDNQTLEGSTQSVAHTLSYSQSITRSDDLSLACSVLGVRNPGTSVIFTPICFIGWKHQFQHVPYFIVPERHGTITGNVFRDDQSKGLFEKGMTPLPEVELTLDDRRRTMSHVDGSYRFGNVPRGKHRLVVRYTSHDPFFFTTPSELEVDEDAIVDFGIGYSLSGLMGQVLNDAGEGVAGVILTIQSRGKKWSVTTEADGRFFVSSLVAGDYSVQLDEDSLPAGYSTEALSEPQPVTVGATSPGRAAFTARAYRSISGRVLNYDTKIGRYVPVNQARVNLQHTSQTFLTDSMGQYLFRDLAAGTYSLSVQNHAETRTVQLHEQPVDLLNVDLQIGTPDTPVLPAPTIASSVAPLEIQLPRIEPPAVQPPVIQPAVIQVEPAIFPKAVLRPRPNPPATAEQHHTLGRQLTKAGRYREAIVELTAAVRMAPNLAMAFNARGFARFKLHDWALAIQDLSQAILLNPRYGDAYRIRAVARRNIRDLSGAASDAAVYRTLVTTKGAQK